MGTGGLVGPEVNRKPENRCPIRLPAFLLQSPIQRASDHAFDDVGVTTIVELDIDHPQHADGNTSGYE
jgi:hypothetical protein